MQKSLQVRSKVYGRRARKEVEPVHNSFKFDEYVKATVTSSFIC